MAKRLAIFNLSPEIGLKKNVFGKDVANFELFRAMVAYGGFDQVDFLMTNPVAPEKVMANLVGPVAGAARIATGDMISHAAPLAAGALLRGSIMLEELAWLRRAAVGDSAYSLIGLIHTLGPPSIRHDLAMTSFAPMQEWDAVICTSPSVHTVVNRIFDELEDHLKARFGGTRTTRPHLPILPLGVDQPAIEARLAAPLPPAREQLGIGPDDIVLLWVGRLSFFEKAFPQVMMRAADEAARDAGQRVHFVMAGWFPNPAQQEPMYRQAADACAPSVAVHFVDGTDRATVDSLWRDADIFISLVDNIQETFGLTPIEAMAAGKPVIVSDWDGYRFTVRDGEEGFLIPTLGGPAGALPEAVVAGHTQQLKSYQQYVAVVAQHTAVHVGRAAAAIKALVASPDLRRRMGEAGRRRVREEFDWRVVAPRYRALTEELGAIRARAGQRARGVYPIGGDPFCDFAGFASEVLADELSVRPIAGDPLAIVARAERIELDMFASGWRGTPVETRAILADLAEGGATVGELLARFPPARRAPLQLSLMWLAKIGAIDWLG